MTVDVLNQDHYKWLNVINESNSTALRKRVDWNGKVNAPPSMNYPSANSFASHFEDLYKNKNSCESGDTMSLQSNVTIPILDDPITTNEVNESIKNMKKGGYDYPLSIVYMLTSMFLARLVLLLNVIFYVKYPIQCAKSLLFTIPKKGNLSTPTNFRFKILNTRLQLWMMVSAEQTAYQKGKSVLNHLFTLRFLINLRKFATLLFTLDFST